MGRPIMDIHAPTLASDAQNSNNSQDDEKASVYDLMARKDRLEADLSALGAVLSSHGVTMNTGLTTFDGFPRSDIDVPQIRTTRAQIIRLRNDHKALMAKIEVALHTHFASNEAKTAFSPSESSQVVGASASISSQNDRPFAKVNSVVSSSPAEAAGLRVGDIVTRFGDATWLNHDKLSKVAQVVSQNEGKQISVTVIRTAADVNMTLNLALTPQRNWGGRGLLGCHLVPM